MHNDTSTSASINTDADVLEYIDVYYDRRVLAELWRGEKIAVRVWRTYRYDGEYLAEVQALTGKPFRAWTHGGWVYSDCEDVHIGLLHNVHDEETLEPIILWPDGDVPY